MSVHDLHLEDMWAGADMDPGERAPIITLAPAFTEKQAAKFDKRTWWVRNDSVKDRHPGRWPLGARTDGTQPLELRLGPGRYTIGAGPPEAFRREIRIGPGGVEVTASAPCLTIGCAGLIEYRPSSPPPACEAFAMTPPADRLCSNCKGSP